MKTTTFLFLLAGAFTFAGCGDGGAGAGKDGEAAAPSGRRSLAIPAARREANELFQSLCATCHGATGHGDGPGAAACNPKPRTFADPTWQASVTDDQIQKTVVFGGAAVGKSAQMPAQPQLKGKTDVLQQLVAIVRGFAPAK